MSLELQLALLLLSTSFSTSLVANLDGVSCPKSDFYPLKVFLHCVPRGNSSAGFFNKIPEVDSLEVCTQRCCDTSSCDVVFFFESVCFHITCKSDELCQPVRRRGQKYQHSVMVAVRSPGEMPNPYDNQSTGDDLATFDSDQEEEGVEGEDDAADSSDDGQLYKNHRRRDGRPLGGMRSPYARLTMMDDSIGQPLDLKAPVQPSLSANMDNDGQFTSPVNQCVDVQCPSGEFCNDGSCECMEGYVRENVTGPCGRVTNADDARQNVTSNLLDGNGTTEAPTTTTLIALLSKGPTLKPEERVVTVRPRVEVITVSTGGNQQIQLPMNSLQITSSVSPTSPQYQYKWTLVSHPGGDETGLMQELNSPTLTVTNLRAGLYTFNLTVTGPNAFGTTDVNVTVLRPTRINQAPVAVVTPTNSTIQLPNKDTVIDGSSSTDDDKVVKYLWEPVATPIVFKLPAAQMLNSAQLQLTNLIPGKYTFKLTVTDSDNITNSTTANVTVLKEIDYPPTAIAGTDVVLNLPVNEVTLNGNLSVDDKGITAWQWTRSPDDDKNKAVDMDGTSTPYLHLSKMELGVYKFTLKVTDTMNQTSKADVLVVVQPESQRDKIPPADAGTDQTVTMPLNTSVYLGPSELKRASKYVRFLWQQVSGPNEPLLVNQSDFRTEVVNLLPGQYTFRVTYTDTVTGENTSANCNLFVIQAKNFPPTANAGGDVVVILPDNLIALNGSNSTDDAGIVSFKWTRESDSLAAGNVLNHSDSKQVLLLTGLVAGHYLFRLTVTDAQGSSSHDIAKVTVKEEADLLDQIEMVLNMDVSKFTFIHETNLMKKLELLLDPDKIQKTRLEVQRETNRVILIFVVNKEKKPGRIPGPLAVRRLNEKLRADANLLYPQILSLNSIVCQNDCSGHGTCDQITKRCQCEAFWMENAIRVLFGDRESNCDWSVLYVVVVAVIVLGIVCLLFWSFTCLLTRKAQPTKRRTRWSRNRRHRSRFQPKFNESKFFNQGETNESQVKYTLLNGDEDEDRSACRDMNFDQQFDEVELNNINKSNSKIVKKHLNTTRHPDSSDDFDETDTEEDVMIFDSTSRKRNNFNIDNDKDAKTTDQRVKSSRYLNGLLVNGSSSVKA